MDSNQSVDLEAFGSGMYDAPDFIFWISLGLLLMASAAAFLALYKGRRPVPWFCYGLLVGPIALFELAFLPKCNFPPPPWLSLD